MALGTVGAPTRVCVGLQSGAGSEAVFVDSFTLNTSAAGPTTASCPPTHLLGIASLKDAAAAGQAVNKWPVLSFAHGRSKAMLSVGVVASEVNAICCPLGGVVRRDPLPRPRATHVRLAPRAALACVHGARRRDLRAVLLLLPHLEALLQAESVAQHNQDSGHRDPAPLTLDPRGGPKRQS